MERSRQEVTPRIYRRMLTLALTAQLLAGCTPKPPPPPVSPWPRPPQLVEASLGHTWDAAISYFSSNSILIRTIERSSGIIVTEPVIVAPRDGVKWAWCGWKYQRHAEQEWTPIGASGASYNVLVHGDSTTATLRVTVRWTSTADGECLSRDVFEPTLEQAIAQAAELEDLK